MKEDIKSGKELLDSFFGELPEIEGVEADVASSLMKLYQEGKFTNTNITNELHRLREEKSK